MNARRTALVVALSASACGPIDSERGTLGAAKSGGFYYVDEEPFVATDSNAGYIPDEVAVGSSFGLEFEGAASATLGSINKANLVVEDIRDGITWFRALGAGYATVEARDDEGAFLDFVSVRLVPISALPTVVCGRVFNAIGAVDGEWRRDECEGDEQTNATLSISLGASLAPTFCVAAQGASGEPLGGLLDCEFTPAGTAELGLHTQGACATVDGLTVGNSVLTVRAGGTETTVNVEVTP